MTIDTSKKTISIKFTYKRFLLIKIQLGICPVNLLSERYLCKNH